MNQALLGQSSFKGDDELKQRVLNSLKDLTPIERYFLLHFMNRDVPIELLHAATPNMFLLPLAREKVLTMLGQLELSP